MTEKEEFADCGVNDDRLIELWKQFIPLLFEVHKEIIKFQDQQLLKIMNNMHRECANFSARMVQLHDQKCGVTCTND